MAASSINVNEPLRVTASGIIIGGNATINDAFVLPIDSPFDYSIGRVNIVTVLRH